MTSSNGKIFRVTGHLCGEFTHGEFPHTKASDAELWCFLWSAPEQTIMCDNHATITHYALNELTPRQNGRHFPDDIFKCIFLSENMWISIKISLKFVPKGTINNIPALVHIMAWRRPGDKPLSEPLVSLLTHIYASVDLNGLIQRVTFLFGFIQLPS